MSVDTPFLSATEITDLNGRFAAQTPREVLTWALGRFHPRLALASSFGAEDMVLIDMLAGLESGAKVVSLDTLRLHTETYEVIDEVRRRYPLDLTMYYPRIDAVDNMTREHGYNCFYSSVDHRKLCCGIRKVEPLERALAELDAWITGLRRDQAATRTEVQWVEADEAHPGMIKVNPLASWSNEDVWAYIHEHQVPYNALHDQGYPSIGCAPCTRAVQPGEDPRAGRWWWEAEAAAKECGIHVAHDETGVASIMRASGGA